MLETSISTVCVCVCVCVGGGTCECVENDNNKIVFEVYALLSKNTIDLPSIQDSDGVKVSLKHLRLMVLHLTMLNRLVIELCVGVCV